MKFAATLAIASTVAAVASAQTIQINNPTEGSTWTVGQTTNYLGWSGNCAGMGNSSKAVDVELVKGPANMVQYVAKLATIDCSGALNRADITVPDKIASGKYSIRVKTTPQDSYSNAFTVENAAVPPTDAAPSTPPTASPSKTPTGAASSLAVSSLGLAGVAVAALQFAL